MISCQRSSQINCAVRVNRDCFLSILPIFLWFILWVCLFPDFPKWPVCSSQVFLFCPGSKLFVRLCHTVRNFSIFKVPLRYVIFSSDQVIISSLLQCTLSQVCSERLSRVSCLFLLSGVHWNLQWNIHWNWNLQWNIHWNWNLQ